MKITYLTTYDSENIENWSGLGYYIKLALKNQGYDIEAIHAELKNENNLYKSIKILSRILGKGRLDWNREPFVIKDYCHILMKQTSKNTDIFFSPGSPVFSFFETEKPKVFYTDATFGGMLDLYPSFSQLSQHAINNGNFLEQLALDNCSLALYASEWAANTAIKKYNINQEKVKVIPFGANLENKFTFFEIKDSIKKKLNDKVCRLLFIGVEWERKGGEKAVQVAKLLNEMGLRTELYVVGVKNLPSEQPEYVKNIGFISKRTVNGYLQIVKLYIESHFFIMPSMAEAFGVVFSEASSFGVPSISHDIGGIPSAVYNNINGKLFKIDSEAEQMAQYVFNVFGTSEYEKLSLSSYNTYKTLLNWEVAGSKINNYLKEI